jgi:transmembrane sensor
MNHDAGSNFFYKPIPPPYRLIVLCVRYNQSSIVMTEKEARDLLQKYLNGNCNKEENELVRNWYLQWSRDANKDNNEVDDSLFAEQQIWERISAGMQKLQEKEKPPRNGRLVVFNRIAAAAIISGLIVGWLFFFQSDKSSSSMAQNKWGGIDVTVGGKVSMLVEGRLIDLSEFKVGDTKKFPGYILEKSDSNEVICRSTGNIGMNRRADFTSIFVPRGQKFSVVLTDGSKINMNASSILDFNPISVTNNNTVYLTGEASFDISKNSSRVFVVKTLNQMIQVLGTKFNVSAYPGELERTRLLDGYVKIKPSLTGTFEHLYPGQQMEANLFTTLNHTVSPEQSTGWEEDVFIFNATPISDALTRIGRSYDVDISVLKSTDGILISGEYGKSESIESILSQIENAVDVKFIKNGTHITAM